MKKIYAILLLYWKEDLHKPSFFVLLLYTAMLVGLEYGFHLKKSLLSPYYYTPFEYYFRSFLFYGIPLLGAFFLVKLCNPKAFQWSGGLVVLLFLAISAFMLRTSFREHHQLIPYLDAENTRYSTRLLNNIFLGPLLCFLPACWWFLVDRNRERFYGCTLKGFEPRAYFVLLLLMIPLIVLASTQGDFLDYYPKSAKIIPAGQEGYWQKLLLFEWFYGLDFIYIEFFFRGFMILAFARFLGPEAILVTAVFYCTIHFGKPLGETISSFFGGMILGTLVYKTKSIAGGIMVHMGIAWLMEAGGYIGREFSVF